MVNVVRLAQVAAATAPRRAWPRRRRRLGAAPRRGSPAAAGGAPGPARAARRRRSGRPTRRTGRRCRAGDVGEHGHADREVLDPALERPRPDPTCGSTRSARPVLDDAEHLGADALAQRRRRSRWPGRRARRRRSRRRGRRRAGPSVSGGGTKQEPTVVPSGAVTGSSRSTKPKPRTCGRKTPVRVAEVGGAAAGTPRTLLVRRPWGVAALRPRGARAARTRRTAADRRSS